MKNLVLFCPIFLLIFGCISGEPDVCETLPKFIASKSKSIFTYNDNKYDIEEIQNEKGFGKLIVYHRGLTGEKTVEEEIYFQIDREKKPKIYFQIDREKKPKMVVYSPKENKCTSAKEIEADSQHPYAFYDSGNGLFGPSALLSLVQKDKKFKPKKILKSKDERGILIHECQGTRDLPKVRNSTITLSILDSEWKIYDQKDNKIPIKITIDAQRSIDGKDTKNPFKATIEYYFYKDITDKDNQNLHEFDSKEDYWILPSLCDPLSEEKLYSIPKRVKMIVEEIDELQSEQDESQSKEDGSKSKKDKNKIKKMNLLIDNQNHLVRYQKSNDKMIEIYDSKNHVKINITDKFYCTLSSNAKIVDLDDDLLSFFNDIMLDDDELHQIDDYRLIGEQHVRNEITKVYRKSKNLDSGIIQVNTVYLQEITSELNRNSFTRDLVQMRIEKYQENDLKPISSKLFNFYDFEYIREDEDLVRNLDVSECIHDSEMETEFDLISINYTKLTPNNDTENPNEILKQQGAHKEIRKAITAHLVRITGKNLINFPKVEVDINSKEIISRIKFIDYIAPVYYFERVSNPPMKENSEPDNKTDVSSTFECSYKCLKNKESTGLQYCNDIENHSHFCDLLKTKELKVTKQDENCVTIRKHEDAMKEEFNYESVEDNLNKIENEVLNNKITLNFTRVNAMYTFNKLHKVKEQSKIDRSQLFKLVKAGVKLSKKVFKKKFEIEDGITNVASCYDACTNPKNGIGCDSFSFCKKFEKKLFDCYVGTLFESGIEIDSETFEKDSDCDVYQVISLIHFQEHEKMKLNQDDKGMIAVHESTESIDCAQKCLNYNLKNQNKEACLSIDICKNLEDKKTTCRLSKNHTLWVNSNGLLKDDDNCNVFSVKHILNFQPTTFKKLSSFITKDVKSLDQCSTTCSAEEGCDTFNYCEYTNVNQCKYVSKNVQETESDQESDKDSCSTFIQRKNLINLENIKPKYIYTGKGFKPLSVTGFVFLFLVIGMIVGAIGFYGQKFYLNRDQHRSGSENIAVNFSNLRDDV